LDSLRSIATVPVPAYRERRPRCGIVHFGVGGFHRAHQAMYLDRLLGEVADDDGWGICGVGLMPGDARMRDALVPQDCLYTLTLRHPDGREDIRVVGSLVDYLFAPADPEAVLGRLTSPETRIVSLTITEGGYNFSPTTGRFDERSPEVRADLEPDAVPRTVFGYVVESLRRRRDAGLGSFTVMSCDNIAGNGEVAREMFTAFARLKDPELASWIAEHTSFPSSMVDRITPATAPELLDDVEQRTGIADRWPVVTEPFSQWVLEDHFVAGRPPLEKVGVQIVDDVAPYERMKLRLLNGSHQALAYFGHLLGHHYVHDATEDPLLHELVRRYMDWEAEPTLDPVPGIDLVDYKRTLFVRFGNHHIADTVARLAAEASDRIPKWVVPVVRDQLASGGSVAASAAVIAGWTRYAEGVDESGREFRVVDRLADRLVPLARSSREEPLAFLRDEELFGDLASHSAFTEPYVRTLDLLHKVGARKTLATLVG
jgi:mannitol 2-dehydrogenase